MTIADVRSQFSTRLLSSCTAQESSAYVQILEEMVRNSEYGVAPGPTWIGPRNDTLLVFLDTRLIGAVCIRIMAFLDPLVFDETDVPFPALVLNELRLRAEGFLLSQGHREYYFNVPEQAKQYIDGLLSMGGVEEITGVRSFRRKL